MKLRQKHERVSAIEMYSSIIHDMLTSGSDEEIPHLGSDKIHVGYNRLTTESCTKMYFYVKSLPKSVPVSLMQDLRDYAATDGVRINFMGSMQPQTIDWESTNMKDMQDSWEHMLSESADEEGKFLESQKTTLKSERERWLMQSWRYISESDKNRHALISSNLIIEIRTVNNLPAILDNLPVACDRVKKYCAQRSIQIMSAKGFMLDFLQYISPLADNGRTISGGMIPSRVLTDEIVAGMTSYTPGKLTQTEVQLGIDTLTNMMTYIDFKNVQSKSLNMMIAATTSSGKSTFNKCFVRELNATGKNVIILDRDGEYNPITNKCSGTVIDLRRQHGRYFDSMQIGDLTYNEEIDSGLFTDSMMTTTSIFNSLSAYGKGMSTSERKIFNDAYNRVLVAAGVEKQNRASWVNSAKLRYHDLYAAIVTLSKDSEYVTRYGNVIHDFVDKLSVYFDPNGLRSHMFQEKIGINDILQSKQKGRGMVLDICLYLDADTDKTEEGQIETAIKFITANYLTILLTNYFKSLDEITVVLVEEYQRYLATDDMQPLVLNMVTGNRKRNAATILTTNSPQDILNANKETTQALVDNIKNLVIGRIESTSTVINLCKTWNMEYCIPVLTDIATKSVYDHCFLVKLDGGELAVVKQLLPPNLLHSELFSTSDIWKPNKTREAGA